MRGSRVDERSYNVYVRSGTFTANAADTDMKTFTPTAAVEGIVMMVTCRSGSSGAPEPAIGNCSLVAFQP